MCWKASYFGFRFSVTHRDASFISGEGMLTRKSTCMCIRLCEYACVCAHIYVRVRAYVCMCACIHTCIGAPLIRSGPSFVFTW